jgi:DNA-binding NtrC family response regulator
LAGGCLETNFDSYLFCESVIHVLYPNRLLVVDDVADFLEIVTEVASSMGYEVQSASCASEFKDLYLSFKPAVCVIDIVMPNEDGVSILEWLSKLQERPRVVIVSGYNPFFMRMASLLSSEHAIKVSATLVKPVSITALRDAIGKPQ